MSCAATPQSVEGYGCAVSVVLPEKCKEHIDFLVEYLNDIGDFLRLMKCPYAKDLYTRSLEIVDSLKAIERCKKCNCDVCECILDEAVEELMRDAA